MKKLILLLLVTALGFALFADAATGHAGSCLMRIHGAEAVYHNPALIDNPQHLKLELSLLNFQFSLVNNTFSNSLYNRINGDSLSQADKDYILAKMDKKLLITTDFHTQILSVFTGDGVLTTASHLLGNIAIDREYFRLILEGNEASYDRIYNFNHANNDFAVLAYTDISYGRGDLIIKNFLPLRRPIPAIKVGFSISYLRGIYNLNCQDYHGTMSTNDDTGLSLDQTIVTRISKGGNGFKASLGLAVEPLDNLECGFALDNILGTIIWHQANKERVYNASRRNMYLNKIDGDFFDQRDSTYSVDTFSTRLPLTMRWGVLYNIPAQNISFSIDWKQLLQDSSYHANKSFMSVGATWQMTTHIPLQLGYEFANKDKPYAVALGTSLNTSIAEFSIAYKTYGNVFPGNKATGFRFSFGSKLRF